MLPLKKLSFVVFVFFINFQYLELKQQPKSKPKIPVATHNRSFDIKINKMSCRVNPKYLVNVTCELKPVRNKPGIVNAAVDIIKPLDFGWVIKIKLNKSCCK